MSRSVPSVRRAPLATLRMITSLNACSDRGETNGAAAQNEQAYSPCHYRQYCMVLVS
ncbi:hypothetical protein [Photorhabdus luminescens]|uniref:hypothetical protein n=1 Tax=Photorhabdus luminescens TaxID=29488 RepID=UPI001595C3D4|nr:hypothetical protein [Photorhabdus luminescens]